MYQHKDVLPFVNDKDMYDRFQRYVEYRILSLLAALEIAKGADRITELQGRLAELRRFQNLKETAHHKAENKE